MTRRCRPSKKLSLAISGWLMGGDEALDNLGVSASLVKVRALVRQYLVTTRKPDRDAILSQLTSQEGATNQYIAAIIAHMKPPMATDLVAAAGRRMLAIRQQCSVCRRRSQPSRRTAKSPRIPTSECARKKMTPALLKGVPSTEHRPLPKGEPPPAQPEPKIGKEQAQPRGRRTADGYSRIVQTQREHGQFRGSAGRLLGAVAARI